MIAPDDLATPGAPSIPDLLRGAAMVALVPATAELDAAATLAWQFARSATCSGRRIALVDCYVDEPQLHTAAGESNREGIVDVFEYGASLSRIARPQPEQNLFFVPAGTFSPDPVAMMANPRWRRLAAGFRHEDAVMLLFLPAECAAALAADLDGIVALTPGGAEAGLASTPEIEAAVESGAKLLATMTEPVGAEPKAAVGVIPEPAPAAPDATAVEEPVEPGRPAAKPALRRPLQPGARRFRLRWAVYAVALLVAAVAGIVNYRKELGLGDLGLSRLGLRGRLVEGASEERDVAAPRALGVPGFRRLVPHAVDSLPFAVQVSAWTGVEAALEAGDTLEERGFPPIVAPLRVDRRIWYRVYAGPVATQHGADSLLGAVRRAGLDRPNAAVTSLVPLSFALKRVASPAVARAERSRLRAAGIPAFVLGQADGSYRLFAGAYETPAQAAYLDSLLTSTGSAGQTGPRVGFRP